MRQKIERFRQHIRKDQINNYFKTQRERFLTSAVNGREVTLVFNQDIPQRDKRVRDEEDMELERRGMEEEEENRMEMRLDWTENELIQLRELCHWEKIVQIMDEISVDLNKICSGGVGDGRKIDLLQYFLKKNTLMTVVSILNQAFCDNLHRGLLQSLSKRATKVLYLSIKERQTYFDEELFINSKILSFLRCAVEEPKYDHRHLSRICFIIDHMVMVSSTKLYSILNDRGSTFHFGAIHFNISKVKLYPGDRLTENYIGMMKNYLCRVGDDVIEHQRKNLKQRDDRLIGQDFCCLTLGQIEIALQIAIMVFKESSPPSFQDSNEALCLHEVLQVIRLIIQNFKVKQSYKDQLDYKKMMTLLSLRDCITQIKETLLAIIDHLIYDDSSGKTGYRLLGECSFLELIWQLKQEYSSYVMNILCNLALDSNLKQFLRPHNHNIFLQLKFDINNKLLITYMFNWFHSQKFAIADSMEKVMLQTLSEMEEVSKEELDMVCCMWLNLARHNEIHIPTFVLDLNSHFVKMIKEEILGLTDDGTV